MTRTRLLMLPTAILVLALAGSAIVLGQQQATTPEALMGAAQHQEDVEGNLDAAIATYRKVADNPKAPRALAASALLQMGRLHEKLGSREATRAYERIAKEFADQPTIVAQARSRLTALGGASATAADAQVVARQVWAGRDTDPFGSVSPDGLVYAFVDWQNSLTGNVAIRDLASGQSRHLTQFRTFADGFADSVAVSADGRRVAYVWSPPSPAAAEVRIVASDGTATRTLFTRKDAYPWTLRWSPDGLRLAFVSASYATDETNDIVVIDTVTGRVVSTTVYGTRSLVMGGFSPDGRYVAYGVSPLPSGEDGRIDVLSLDAGTTKTVISGPHRNTLPAWTPDGTALVYLSDRSGAPGLWRTAFADGQPFGQPQLLRPNTGDLTTLFVSRDGAIWYGVTNGVSDIYVCDFDPVRLRAGTPQRLTDRFVGANSGAAWSPDGRSIAFMRGTDRRKRAVVIRSLEDQRERELPAPFVDTVHASNWGPTWLPDSSGVLVTDVNFGTGHFTVHELGVSTEKVSIALEGDFRQAWPQIRVSPDGRSLYFVRRLAQQTNQGQLLLVRRDRATGTETELYRAPSRGAVGFFGLALSPDGTSLTFGQNVEKSGRDLMLIPAAGGEARVLYRGRYTMPQPGTGGFTRDGRHVLISGRDEKTAGDGAMNKLFAVPVSGGAPVPTGLERRGGIGAVSPSPDGTRVVFTGGDRTGELWTIRNLLAPVPARARR